MEHSAYEVLETVHPSDRTVVQRGRRSQTGEQVLLKMSAQQPPIRGEVPGLQREARLLELLQGPGIPKPVRVVESGTPVALAVEDEGGCPLDTHDAWPIEAALAVAVELTALLAHVHERGVAHLDLNPCNIVKTAAGAIQLIDFGIAEELSLHVNRRAARDLAVPLSGADRSHPARPRAGL